MTETNANGTETEHEVRETREAWVAPRITRMQASDAQLGSGAVVEGAFNYAS
jgi:hypothetical protein